MYICCVYLTSEENMRPQSVLFLPFSKAHKLKYQSPQYTTVQWKKRACSVFTIQCHLLPEALARVLARELSYSK